MKFDLKVFLLTCLALSTTILPFTSNAADEPPSPSIVLRHRPPDAKDLPHPSALMPLNIEVGNSRSVGLNIRLVASRDGRLLDINLPEGKLNQADVPVYEALIPAPTAMMTYQFILQKPDGSFIVSDRYTLKRSCVPNPKPMIPEGSNEGDFRREVNELVTKAKALERETSSYESALTLVSELREMAGE